MGIKYLTTYLNDNQTLRHEVCFNWNHQKDAKTETNSVNDRNLIVWDCLGWMKRLYGSHRRTTKLLFDFKPLRQESQKLIETFKRFGFEIIAFVDGYHCDDKIQEKKRRKMQSLKTIRKNIKIIKKMHNSDKTQQKALMNQLEFVPSSGFSHYLEQALTLNGLKVYRGSGKHDIDKDIAQFTVAHKDRIYGIISVDTDYFGFFNLPKHCKLICEFHTKTVRNSYKKPKLRKQTLTFMYYDSSEVWNKLGLNTNDERLQLICLCGNDFVRKRPKQVILRRCGIDTQNGRNHYRKMEEKQDDEGMDITMDTNENKTETVEEQSVNDHINLLDIVAKAIKENRISPSVHIVNVVREFYCIDIGNDDELKNDILCDNVNPTWNGLKTLRLFHGGFFYHDVDARQFTIHQKLAVIRRALILRNMDIDEMNELIPIWCAPNGNVVYEKRFVNLKAMKYEANDLNLRLMTKHKTFKTANLYLVFQNTLDILMKRYWIDDVQYVALQLQFELRFSLRKAFPNAYGKWPFSKKYIEFKKSGVPRIKDLTAQCLYWECSRLLCLNRDNILPNICNLFDGPLFHFFCFEQSNGDENGIIIQLLHKLKESKALYHSQKNKNKNKNKNKRYNRNINNNEQHQCTNPYQNQQENTANYQYNAQQKQYNGYINTNNQPNLIWKCKYDAKLQ